MKTLSELRKISPGNVLDSKVDLIHYLKDSSYFTGKYPIAGNITAQYHLGM
jgi:hypothetical protein